MTSVARLGRIGLAFALAVAVPVSSTTAAIRPSSAVPATAASSEAVGGESSSSTRYALYIAAALATLGVAYLAFLRGDDDNNGNTPSSVSRA
jgi:hypothetical protein